MNLENNTLKGSRIGSVTWKINLPMPELAAEGTQDKKTLATTIKYIN
ncbi:MAG: hypothetical protein NUV45_03640 [Tepidanaerobacteraceae bacterium]|jgi:hypothetical protein|nr:hypothetical protein [Tepidanaerobacteraceae bacterium]